MARRPGVSRWATLGPHPASPRRVAVLPVRDTFVKKLLKSGHRAADSPHVLVERLIVEGDGEAASVDFHPRLTVLGGMPGDARGALGSLLSGALHGTVRGVHLEVVDDAGRRLVVLRPATGPHRVIDVLTSADVTAQHRGFDGPVHLLSTQHVRRTGIVPVPVSQRVREEMRRRSRERAARPPSKGWANDSSGNRSSTPRARRPTIPRGVARDTGARVCGCGGRARRDRHRPRPGAGRVRRADQQRAGQRRGVHGCAAVRRA